MFIGTGLGHYARLMRQWLPLLVGVLVVCTGITYAINSIITPVYEASALIQVHDTGESNNNVFTDQALAQSYALLINRPDVLETVAKQIPGLNVRQLTNQVSASPLDNTQIIQIRAQAKSADLAANLTNTIATTFITLQVNQATAQLKTVASQLEKDLNSAKEITDNDQSQLLTLQTTHASDELITHLDDVLRNDQINYNALESNYNQVQQQLSQEASILTIVQPATVPTAPTSPNKILNTVIAALLSLLLTIVFIILLDWMNTTIKTPDDVEHLAGMNALGSLPFCQEHEGDDQPDEAVDLPIVGDHTIERACVGVGTYTLQARQDKQILLLTSLHTKAGTSTTVVNLATTLAHSGLRVLLIDANLQSASLHTVFQHPNNSGLTTTLVDNKLFQSSPARNIHGWLNQWKTSIPNLWFLPSGPIPPQQGQILQAPSLRLLLRYLTQPIAASGGEGTTSGLVDIVLLDTASLSEGTDTLALAPATNASMLVIEAGKEQGSALRKAQSILQRLGSAPLGVVVNRQKPKHRSYFYSGRFHQGDQDGDGGGLQSLQPRAAIAPASIASAYQEHQNPHSIPAIKPETLITTPRAVSNVGSGLKPLMGATVGETASGSQERTL